MQGAVSFLARKYAQAWYNLNAASFDVNDLIRVKELYTYLTTYTDIVPLYCLPTMQVEDQKKGMKKVIEHFKLEKKLLSLVELLIHDRRLQLLPVVLKQLMRIAQQ